jgi:uncharacterized MAPEG superfamily protein
MNYTTGLTIVAVSLVFLVLSFFTALQVAKKYEKTEDTNHSAKSATKNTQGIFRGSFPSENWRLPDYIMFVSLALTALIVWYVFFALPS